MLVDAKERRRSQQDIAEQLTRLLEAIAGGERNCNSEQTIAAGGGGGAGLRCSSYCKRPRLIN